MTEGWKLENDMQDITIDILLENITHLSMLQLQSSKQSNFSNTNSIMLSKNVVNMKSKSRS